MTSILVLNVILAVAVIGAVLRLLSWAIASSRPDRPRLVSDIRRPAPRPHTPRPHAPHPQWSAANRHPGAREPVDA